MWGIGMSILREGTLVLAIGAVLSVPLGDHVRVAHRPKVTFPDERVGETWLEFFVGSHSLTLQERESAEIEGYHFYVEQSWAPGVPGTDECVSICLSADSKTKLASMRSAILLGSTMLKMVSWDGTEQFG